MKTIAVLLAFFSSACSIDAASHFSIDLRGWSGKRTLVERRTINSLLNTSPGEYSHLRGGQISDEEKGPEFLFSANYFFNKNLAVSLGTGFMPGKTSGNFVEDGVAYAMYWKTAYYYFPLNVEYKVPFVSAEHLWIKVFAGGSWHLLKAEIKSGDYQEDILDTDASGQTIGFQYGILLEYALTKRLSIFYNSVRWHGTTVTPKANGSPLRQSDFRLDSDEDFKVNLEGMTQFVGLRAYF